MASTKFRPLHDRVLVQALEAETKTAGGVILPDTAQEKPQEGKVVSTGPGMRGEDGKLVKPDVKKGDRILYGKWSGTQLSNLSHEDGTAWALKGAAGSAIDWEDMATLIHPKSRIRE